MSPTEAISAVFGKYATFEGRASRPEYWWWWLFTFLLFTVIQLAFFAVFTGDGNAAAVSSLYGLVALGLFLPSLAVFVRRLHDTGRSGWWFLIGLIPVVGWIVLFIFMVQEGNPGPNEYGDPPS